MSSLGVLGLLCIWVRGTYWLAPVVALTVQYGGDAGGHIYYWLAEGNTNPGNIGVPLWMDFILPIVAWILYIRSSHSVFRQRHPVSVHATTV